MTVKEAIEKRRSIRKYQSRDIEPEVLNEVLMAGVKAPSAKNLQNWKFIAVTDKSLMGEMQKACLGQACMGSAPAAIAVCATEETFMNCRQSRATVDCSIALSFMMLRATELGLGTVWLGAFDAGEVKKVLGLPENYIPIAVTPIGYPDEEPEARPRKDFSEVVLFNKQ